MNTVNIYHKDEGEFCHVAFSDSNFQGYIATMIPSEQAEGDASVSAQNGLGMGNYRVKITVTGETRVSPSRIFSLVVTQDNLQLIPIGHTD